MLRDAAELCQLLAKEAVGVLAGIYVTITDDVGVRVADGQIAVHPSSSPLPRFPRRCVLVGAEDNTPVGVLEIVTNQKPHSSVIPADECQDWRFV